MNYWLCKECIYFEYCLGSMDRCLGFQKKENR